MLVFFKNLFNFLFVFEIFFYYCFFTVAFYLHTFVFASYGIYLNYFQLFFVLGYTIFVFLKLLQLDLLYQKQNVDFLNKLKKKLKKGAHFDFFRKLSFLKKIFFIPLFYFNSFFFFRFPAFNFFFVFFFVLNFFFIFYGLVILVFIYLLVFFINKYLNLLTDKEILFCFGFLKYHFVNFKRNLFFFLEFGLVFLLILQVLTLQNEYQEFLKLQVYNDSLVNLKTQITNLQENKNQISILIENQLKLAVTDSSENILLNVYYEHLNLYNIQLLELKKELLSLQDVTINNNTNFQTVFEKFPILKKILFFNKLR